MKKTPKSLEEQKKDTDKFVKDTLKEIATMYEKSRKSKLRFK